MQYNSITIVKNERGALMIFSQDWVNEEKDIIFTKFPETFTWEEYHESSAELVEMISSVNHIVDVVSDVTNSRLPKGNPFPHFNRFVNTLPPNTGAVVNFGSNKVERVLASAFLYVYSKRFETLSLHVVLREEEAYAIIAKRKQKY